MASVSQVAFVYNHHSIVWRNRFSHSRSPAFPTVEWPPCHGPRGESATDPRKIEPSPDFTRLFNAARKQKTVTASETITGPPLETFSPGRDVYALDIYSHVRGVRVAARSPVTFQSPSQAPPGKQTPARNPETPFPNQIPGTIRKITPNPEPPGPDSPPGTSRPDPPAREFSKRTSRKGSPKPDSENIFQKTPAGTSRIVFPGPGIPDREQHRA